MSNVTISLLGGIRVKINGQNVVDDRQARVKLLLGYLATESGRTHRRETLCDLFWPHLSLSAARHNLRQYLHLVRKILDTGEDIPQPLLVERDSVRFNVNENVRTDLENFFNPPSCDSSGKHCRLCLEQTEAGAALYTGEFMEGFAVAPELTELENWFLSRREQCRRQVLVLLERLATCHEQNGNTDKALHYAKRWAELDEWNERAHRVLLGLLVATNETASALRHYEALRQTLQRELGSEPEPETHALAEEIRKGNLAPRKLTTTTPPTPQSARKFVTVLYIDLGFPDIADPEEADAQMRPLRSAASAIIAEYGGHLSQLHTGSLLAYFGYPEAQEKAAVRAAASAQAIAQALGNSEKPYTRWRIGLHSGVLIVDGATPLPDSAGLVPATAARLAQLAPEQSILVSDTGMQLLRGCARYEPQGRTSLPGATHAVAVYRLDAVNATLDRLERHGRYQSPLIGRTSDLKRLRTFWKTAASGTPQAVVVSGEAGIGKSRLVRSLLECAPSEQADRLLIQCFEHSEGSAFLPLRQILHKRAQLIPGKEEHKQLVTYLREQGLSARMSDQVATFLTNLNDGTNSATDQHRNAFIRAWPELLKAWAAERPVLMIVEDVHWVDPSTSELLGEVWRQAKDLGRFMMLLTARDTRRVPHLESACTTVELGPLSGADAPELVEHITGPLSPQHREAILHAGDGIPLYLEELGHMLVANPGTEEDPVNIPLTMRELLEVRIDQIDSAKATAQTAAVIGRAFSLSQLESLSELGRETLDEHLLRLRQADLVHLVDPARSEFRFKHALLHQATYESMLQAPRTESHRRFAVQLTEEGVAKNQPELVAHHLNAAGDKIAAFPHWLSAAQIAMRRFAYHEAISHCRVGMEIAAEYPSAARAIDVLALRLTLGAALMATQGYGSPEAHEVFKQAVELSESVDAHSELFLALNGVWRGSSSYLGLKAGREVAVRALEVARRYDIHRHLVRAHVMLGITDFHLGDHAAARLFLDQAITMYDNTTDINAWDSIEDPKITALAFQSWNLWMLGEREAAIEASEAAMAWAKRLEHIGSICFAIKFAIMLYWFEGDPARVRHYCAELRSLGVEYNLMYWIGNSDAYDGWARCRLGDLDALEQLETTARALVTVMPGQAPQYQSALADIYLLVGRYDEAVEQINNALEFNMHIHDHSFEPELRRMLGEAKCAMGDMESGIEELFRAAEIAEQSPAWAERIEASIRRWAISSKRPKKQKI